MPFKKQKFELHDDLGEKSFPSIFQMQKMSSKGEVNIRNGNDNN